jgi:hypothetical protein
MISNRIGNARKWMKGSALWSLLVLDFPSEIPPGRLPRPHLLPYLLSFLEFDI